jgi:RNA polymerase sigma factor (sigma-70 family)
MNLIELLPPPQRAVLLLYFLERFPLAEIAGIVGAPLGTVKSRLHHAKRMLRGLVERPAR